MSTTATPRRSWMTDEVVMLRDLARSFYEREIVPHQERWREQGQVDREVWRKAGARASCARGSTRSTAARAATSSTPSS